MRWLLKVRPNYSCSLYSENRDWLCTDIPFRGLKCCKYPKKKHCVSGSLSLNYGLLAEPPERRAPVVGIAETRACETVHIYGDTQVSARIVWTRFNKYRRDTRQQVDFTASHILVALPHILSSRPLAFMESVKIASWLKHFCRRVIVRKGVHRWAAEYIHLCCVQGLQSARMKNFCIPTGFFFFLFFSFLFFSFLFFVSWLALLIHICADC